MSYPHVRMVREYLTDKEGTKPKSKISLIVCLVGIIKDGDTHLKKYVFYLEEVQNTLDLKGDTNAEFSKSKTEKDLLIALHGVIPKDRRVVYCSKYPMIDLCELDCRAYDNGCNFKFTEMFSVLLTG